MKGYRFPLPYLPYTKRCNTFCPTLRFKKILNQIGFYVIFGFTILGFTIIYVGLGTRSSSPNVYLIIIGLSFLLPLIIYLISIKIKSKRNEERHQRELFEFKRKAIKVKVDLGNVSIKSNCWNDIVVTDKTKYAGFNELFGDTNRNVKSVRKSLNHVSIKIPYQGKTIKYDFSNAMDITKLKIHFAIKKETTLYIDPVDKNRMYLDLEFIE